MWKYSQYTRRCCLLTDRLAIVENKLLTNSPCVMTTEVLEIRGSASAGKNSMRPSPLFLIWLQRLQKLAHRQRKTAVLKWRRGIEEFVPLNWSIRKLFFFFRIEVLEGAYPTDSERDTPPPCLTSHGGGHGGAEGGALQ